MDENKVTIPLKDYIKLYEGQKERDKELQILLELIFANTELKSNKELKFDYYDTKLMKYLKEKYPEKYAKQVEFLIKEEEE